MNILLLKEVARLFGGFENVAFVGRIDDNLIELKLDSTIFYIDLSKSKSTIFCTNERILSLKKYKAPFDFALQKYCLKAQIKDCKIDGNNRILELFLQKKFDYKIVDCKLQLEFTGKYTNAIILDSQNVVLECLRKVAQNIRVIKVGEKLESLPQQENFMPKEIDFGGDILAFLHQNYTNKQNEILKSAKITATNALLAKKKKLESTLQNLPNRDKLMQDSAYFSRAGELMLNNMGRFFSGEVVELSDFSGEIVSVKLPKKVENLPSSVLLNEFYKISKKLSAKSKNIAIQEQNLLENIAFLESKIDFINRAKSLNEIKIINPKSPQKPTKSPQNVDSKSYEIFFIDDFKVSIGKNKKANIALLQNAKANDVWLHLRDIPSAHAIISCGKASVPPRVLQIVANMLVSFVKYKSGDFIADYTKRKFVKIKNEANVVYSNFESLSVRKE